MRYIAFLISFIALAGCAKPQVIRQSYPPERIKHMSQIQKMKDPGAIASHVAYLDDGDIIPVKIKIESDLFGLYQDQIDLIVKQKTYFRIALPPTMSRQNLEKIKSLDLESFAQLPQDEKNKLFKGMMLYLSPDAIHWALLNDMKTIKKIFGLQGGDVSVGLALSDTEGIWALLSVKIHKQADQ